MYNFMYFIGLSIVSHNKHELSECKIESKYEIHYILHNTRSFANQSKKHCNMSSQRWDNIIYLKYYLYIYIYGLRKLRAFNVYVCTCILNDLHIFKWV